MMKECKTNEFNHSVEVKEQVTSAAGYWNAKECYGK